MVNSCDTRYKFSVIMKSYTNTSACFISLNNYCRRCVINNFLIELKTKLISKSFYVEKCIQFKIEKKCSKKVK